MKRPSLALIALIVASLACNFGQSVPPAAAPAEPASATLTPPPSTPSVQSVQSVTQSVATSAATPVLFTIGVHIEPLGAVPSELVGGSDAARPGNPSGGDYHVAKVFEHHAADLLAVADIAEAHGGRLTVQAQSPFTTVALQEGNTVLADLRARGHEIGLHFHEDAHLGRNPESLPTDTWCAVMREEIDWVKQASGASQIRYWSGGNLYPDLLDAAACAGLSVNSDWKNPDEQATVEELIGLNPWRPAGGSNGNDVTLFARHDPSGPVIFLPEGLYDRNDFASMRRSDAVGGDEAYFEFLEESLLNSVAAAQAGRVNVFHFTVHAGEFRGDASDPFGVIDRFLTEVVDPLVASGQVRWATFSEMADAFAAWEAAHPGVDPRGMGSQ